MKHTVRTTEDVLSMLDRMFAPGADRWTDGAAGWWDTFYADRSRPVPFFAAQPDENLDAHLRSGLGLTCFATGFDGSEVPDEELYRAGGLGGGLAYTPEELRWIFSDFAEVELRPMTEQAPESPLFGVPFLLTALFRRS